MGSYFSSMWSRLFALQTQVRVLMIGLDAAGKTTLLYKLKLNETVSTVPTIGFNVEAAQYKNVSFTIWDVGGQDKIRSLWRYYFTDVDAIIYVVDSNDCTRMEQARDELIKVLSDPELAEVPLLVFANKQDINDAMTVPEVTQQLQLELLQGRKWFIQGSCAIRGNGLNEGLDWLANNIYTIR